MRQPKGAAGPVLLRAVARHRRAEYGPASSSAARLEALADWLASGCPDPDVERAGAGITAQAASAGISLPAPAPGCGEVRSTQTIFPLPCLPGEGALFLDYIDKKDEAK